MSQHKGKIAGIIVLLLIIFYAIAVYWSTEPSRFDVVANAKEQAQLRKRERKQRKRKEEIGRCEMRRIMEKKREKEVPKRKGERK